MLYPYYGRYQAKAKKDSYSLAPTKGYKRELRALFLTSGRIIIFRTFISKESKKILPSKYAYSETIRKDLGCHPIQPSHITDEVMGTQRREVKFPKETVNL